MKEHNFYIVTLCYNCEEYIKDCLESIISQQYNKYKVIIIDDNSSDKTVAVINSFLDSYPYFKDKFIFIQNDNRIGPLANHIKALDHEEINEDDIVLHLDGDDLLTTSSCLKLINKCYTDNPKHLVSYGNYESTTNRNICKPWSKGISVKEYIYPIGWIFSHVRTFKYKLWKYIDKDKSFYDKSGNVFSSAGDVAIMKPVLELAGRHRTMFIPKKIYYYRDNLPTNEHHINFNDQIRCALEIKDKPQYNTL